MGWWGSLSKVWTWLRPNIVSCLVPFWWSCGGTLLGRHSCISWQAYTLPTTESKPQYVSVVSSSLLPTKYPVPCIHSARDQVVSDHAQLHIWSSRPGTANQRHIVWHQLFNPHGTLPDPQQSQLGLTHPSCALEKAHHCFPHVTLAMTNDKLGIHLVRSVGPVYNWMFHCALP